MTPQDCVGKEAVLKNGKDCAFRPDGKERMKPGETFLIEAVKEIDGVVWLGYGCPGKSCMDFGAGWQQVNIANAEIVWMKDPAAPAAQVCTCPTLIWGHHQGCYLAK